MSVRDRHPSRSLAGSDHPIAGLAVGQPITRLRRLALSRLGGALLLVAGNMALGGCATLLDRDPVRVDVVALDPLPSEALEWRFAVRLRIQNPNEAPIEFDGAAVEIDVRGVRLGSGVSDQKGTVPRFGEALVTLPITVPVTALLRQGLAFARNPDGRADYRVRGKLAGPLFGSTRFESTGELKLPAALR